MPARLNRQNFRKYRHSSATTEYREFPGRSHYLIAEKGWEEVADFALNWAAKHAVGIHPQVQPVAQLANV